MAPAPFLSLFVLAAMPPGAFEVNSPKVEHVGGNVTMTFGNVVLPNDAPASLVVNANLGDKELADLGKQVAGRLYRQLAAEKRAVARDEGETRKWEIPDLNLLRAPIQDTTRALERLMLAIEGLQTRFDRDDTARAAFVAELTRLREQFEIHEAQARLERARWRTESSETLGLTAAFSGPQGAVDAVAAASLLATLDVLKVGVLSRWDRVVRLYAGVSVGYASLWRLRQLVGAPPAAVAIGGVREDLATAAVLFGISSRWQAWRAALQSDIGTRPFTGGGLRWTVGGSVAHRVADGRWWGCLGLDFAPVDTGVAVDDRRFVPFGQPPSVTTRLALPMVMVGLGAMAVFP